MEQNRRKGLMRFAVFVIAIICGSSFVLAEVTDGLIAYWPLDEDGGTTAADIFGGHDGTVYSGATWVTGKLNGAIDTHNSGYIQVPEHSELRPVSGVSVQAWVSMDSFTLWEGIAGNIQDNGSNESGYCLYVTNDGIGWYVSDGSFKNLTSPSLATGQWIHFVGTCGGGSVRLYMNGQEVAGSPVSFGSSINWTYMPISFNIGRYYDDNENFPADCRVDEVAVWNRALTEGEIDFLYNGGNGNPVVGAAIGITESGGTTVVEEGGATDSYEISLYSEPQNEVEVTVIPGDGQVDLGSGAGVSITKVFLPATWSAPQTVTVTAYDDDVYEGEEAHKTTISHSVVSDDPDYNGLNVSSVVVDVIDNELTCGDWGYYATDLNHDCYVNMEDFALFASEWLKGL